MAIIPFPDGSFIIEFSYWLPLDGGGFQLVNSRTMAPHAEGLGKVIGTLLPDAVHKPEYGKDLRTGP